MAEIEGTRSASRREGGATAPAAVGCARWPFRRWWCWRWSAWPAAASKQRHRQGARQQHDARPTATSSDVFGTMTEPVCGKAPAGETNKATGLGVTADQIEVGTISDVGFSGAPGLNQELFDASDVFTKWCNSLGRHQRPPDQDRQARRRASSTTTPADREGLRAGLRAGRRRRRVRQHRPEDPAEAACCPTYPAYLVTSRGPGRGPDRAGDARPAQLAQLRHGPVPGAEVSRLGEQRSATSPATCPRRSRTRTSTRRPASRFGFKTVYDAQYNATGEPTWVPYRPGHQGQRRQGPLLHRRAARLRPADRGAGPDQLQARLDRRPRPTSTTRRRCKAAGSALDFENVYVGHRHHAVPGHRHRRRSRSTRTCSTSTCPNSTRKQAALGMNSFSAWLLFAQSVKACGARPHPQVRVRQRQQGHELGRRRHPGAVEPVRAATWPVPASCRCRPPPTGWTIVNWEPDIGRLQLLAAERRGAARQLREGRDLAARRQEHDRPPVTTSSTAWTSSSSSRSSG